MHSKLWSSSLGYIPIETKVIALNPDLMVQRVQQHHWHKELLFFPSFHYSGLFFNIFLFHQTKSLMLFMVQIHKVLSWHKMISEMKYRSKNFYARQIMSLAL